MAGIMSHDVTDGTIFSVLHFFLVVDLCYGVDIHFLQVV